MPFISALAQFALRCVSFFQRLQIDKSNICCALIANFFPRWFFQNRKLIFKCWSACPRQKIDKFWFYRFIAWSRDSWCMLIKKIFSLVLFSSALPTFKPLNATYSKFEQLKISRRTSVWQKSRVPGWRILLNRVLQNFELLNHLSWMNQIFGMGRYQK